MSLPSFLCIGAQKAATSWLWQQLRAHPDLWMPPVKELHFFDTLYVEENRKWTRNHIQGGARNVLKWHINHNEVPDFSLYRYLVDLASRDLFTEEWYRRAYDRPGSQGKVTGDVTPEYCTIPEEGIHYVRKLLGQPKLIYIVRDPVDRACSQLRMNAQRRGYESTQPSTDDWISLAQEDAITNRGDYQKYIPAWLEVFDEKDFVFIPYKDVAKNPVDVLRKVETALGASPLANYPQSKEKIHTTPKFSIPDVVIDRLQEAFQPQKQFLTQTLGAEFVDRI